MSITTALERVVHMLDVNHGDNSKVSAFEGIRGFAVFTVFLAHYTTSIEPWIDKQQFGAALFEALRFYGNFGVEMFFVLSGYLIYGGVIRKTFSARRYARKRAQRTYPTFLAAMFIYVLICILVPSQSKFPGGTHQNTLYLVQNLLFLPGIVDLVPLISQAWSLSYEAVYYISLPVLVALVRFRIWTGAQRCLFIVPVLLVYWGVCLALDMSPSRLSAFALDIAAFELKPCFRKLQASALTGGTAILLTIPFATATAAGILPWSYVYVLNCCLIIIFFCMSERNTLARVFSVPFIRWFGNMSYTYFLIHGIIIKFMFLMLGRLLLPSGDDVAVYFLFMPLCFAMTFLVSLTIYCFVEYPMSILPLTPDAALVPGGSIVRADPFPSK